MTIVLIVLAVVFLIVAVANGDRYGNVNGFGAICGFLAVVCVVASLGVCAQQEHVELAKEHARIEKQVNVPELNKYYAYDTKVQDNGKTVIIETTEDSNATNIAKIKEDLSKSDKIKDVQFLSNSDKHAKIILVVKLK